MSDDFSQGTFVVLCVVLDQPGVPDTPTMQSDRENKKNKRYTMKGWISKHCLNEMNVLELSNGKSDLKLARDKHNLLLVLLKIDSKRKKCDYFKENVTNAAN